MRKHGLIRKAIQSGATKGDPSETRKGGGGCDGMTTNPTPPPDLSQPSHPQRISATLHNPLWNRELETPNRGLLRLPFVEPPPPFQPLVFFLRALLSFFSPLVCSVLSCSVLFFYLLLFCSVLLMVSTSVCICRARRKCC